MKICKRGTNHEFFTAIFLFFLLSVGKINSQELLPDQDSLVADPIPVALSEIPIEFAY